LNTNWKIILKQERIKGRQENNYRRDACTTLLINCQRDASATKKNTANNGLTTSIGIRKVSIVVGVHLFSYHLLSLPHSFVVNPPRRMFFLPHSRQALWPDPGGRKLACAFIRQARLSAVAWSKLHYQRLKQASALRRSVATLVNQCPLTTDYRVLTTLICPLPALSLPAVSLPNPSNGSSVV